MNIFRALARPVLASVFIVDAIGALRDPDTHALKLAAVEGVIDKTAEAVPAMPKNRRTLVRLHAGLTLGAGVLFALGKAPRTSATVLALASAPAALIANPVRTGEQRAKNLLPLLNKAAAIAGLTFAATDRKGAPSLGWRYHNWQTHRADLKEAKAAASQ